MTQGRMLGAFPARSQDLNSEPRLGDNYFKPGAFFYIETLGWI